MKCLVVLMAVLLSGCVNHTYESRYDSPHILVWSGSYGTRTLGMHSLEECLRHGYRVYGSGFKCIPTRTHVHSSNVRLRVHGNVNIR